MDSGWIEPLNWAAAVEEKPKPATPCFFQKAKLCYLSLQASLGVCSSDKGEVGCSLRCG